MTKSVTVTFLFRLEGLKLNDTDWINDFKEKRTQYGVSQNRLAVMAGISREYVSRIESGKVALTEEIKGKFTDALEKLNPENPLEMVLDYVRIRFPTQDVRHVVEDILRLKLDVMIHEDYGFYSYAEYGNTFFTVAFLCQLWNIQDSCHIVDGKVKTFHHTSLQQSVHEKVIPAPVLRQKIAFHLAAAFSFQFQQCAFFLVGRSQYEHITQDIML